MKMMLTKLVPAAVILLALPILSASAGDKPFPKTIDTPVGSAPEGFTIGKGHTAYNGSVDGSVYKIDLRSGQGEILVAADSDSTDCRKLGMRVDPRTNYLFIAGCVYGNAYVYDADDGTLVMEYQLSPPFIGAINDLAITEDAVYFTDSFRPVLYRLPLSEDGALPESDVDIEEIPLPDEFILDFDNDFCCGGNGIVATPNGETLIIGHSNLAILYRMDLTTYEVDPISIDPPLDGFLDGIAMRGHTLYIMTPTVPSPVDRIQVVALDKGMLSGDIEGIITDPELDDVASGAIFGNSLYVNNARYSQYPWVGTEFWITKLNIYDVQ
jgi:sugar lactone lactonase YvrE